MPRNRYCYEPLPNQFNGTYSVTSMGGVGSTFLLEWLRNLEQADRQQRECKLGMIPEKALFWPSWDCAALADGGPRRHLVSCHYDDDGIFKHLADPSVLNRFPNHKAIFLVGLPIEAVASVFRRNFQCWHLYCLNNCWFTRAEREGLIPCEQPGIQVGRFEEITPPPLKDCSQPPPPRMVCSHELVNNSQTLARAHSHD